MKFCNLIKCLTVTALFSTITTIHAQPANQYGSTLHPLPVEAVNGKLHPPTDISVINASSTYIYAVVPYTQVNDYLRPGFNDHIYSYDPQVAFTNLVLQDVNRNTFYNAYVCREAIVTVYGYPGNYTITYDDDLCR